MTHASSSPVKGAMSTHHRTPMPSPRGHSQRSTSLTALLVVLVVGGSLLTLQQQRERSTQAGGSPLAVRHMNLGPLGAPPPLALAALPRSTHKCSETKDVNHRVCQFSNLVLHQGTVYYVTDDAELELPQVDVTYHPAPDEKYAPTVLLASKAGFLLAGQNPNEWASIPLSWLWKVTKRWDNLAHHFGEEAVTVHNSLCTHLGECSFPPVREVQMVLLDSRERGALLASVNATLARCVTGWPAVYRDNPRLASRTVVLLEAWSGIGPQCHSQRGCSSDTEYGTARSDKRASMPSSALQSWRVRLGACFAFDVRTPAPTSPKTVLILDRPYEAGRHMLNIRSVERAVRERFPGDTVRLQTFEDVPFPEQLRIMSGTSILVMVHGSAIALWPFLPPNAVAVHIDPDLESGGSLQRVWADHYARDWGFTGLSYVPINNTDASRQHMRWEKIMAQDEYKNLTNEQKLALLEQGECPDKKDQLCSFHWKRQELSLVLDLEQLAWALDTAEADLLRKSKQRRRLRSS